MRKSAMAGMLALMAISLGLIGWGVSATFTDSATATQTIHVGTMGIAITATDANGSVVGKTLTCHPSDILSSVAGSSTCGFKITNTGTIPANITLAVSTPIAPFVSLQPPITVPVVVPAGGLTFTGGMSWPELFNADMNKTATITYTVSATA